MNEPVKLITNRPDVEIAAEHRQKIVEASKPLMEALTAARRDGFVTQLNFGEDAFKNIVINHFLLLK